MIGLSGCVLACPEVAGEDRYIPFALGGRDGTSVADPGGFHRREVGTMPSGAAVIRYPGKRGVVWYLKYRDAAGRQVKERLGPAPDWNRRKAEAELRARLTAVEKDGMRRIEPLPFERFAREWLPNHVETKDLKRSTELAYKQIIEPHLIPAFGKLNLDALDVKRIEECVAAKRRAYAARTINRHLNVLNLLLAAALRRGLIRSNPVPSVNRPREPRRRWRILTPTEVGSVERAFAELIAEAKDEERKWLAQARVIFLVAMGTGLRRGELQGLRWANVHLADPDGASLRVCETWVRYGKDTPKSLAGERTIALGQRVASELFEHRAGTSFAGDAERVFCSPTRGTPFDVQRYTETFREALTKAGITDYVRPFHDLRHSSITNAAAAGTPPAALMARAGHSSFSTTQSYIDLAGETFREEAHRLEARLWGSSGTKTRYQIAPSSPEAATSPMAEPVAETA
jgi:integrase